VKKGGGLILGDDFPGSVPKLSPSSPMRGGVEGKREDTPPSSRFWMELEGGGGAKNGAGRGGGASGYKMGVLGQARSEGEVVVVVVVVEREFVVA